MTGYAGAGLQVVEHQVVWAGGVGAVGAGAGTGAAVPAPAPGQAGVPLLVVGADTPALEWQELLVAATALFCQLTATPAPEMFLHLEISAQRLSHALLGAGLGHDAGHTEAPGVEGEAGVVVVATGAPAPPHLHVGRSQQGEVRVRPHGHHHQPGGAGLGTVAPQQLLNLRVAALNILGPAGRGHGEAPHQD